MIPWYGLLIIFPCFCALVGWVTNVIAVRMIFFPIKPRRIMGQRLQGVLPKHHEYFSREMAAAVTGDFMTTGELVERLDAPGLLKAVKPRLEPVLDRVLEELRTMLPPAQRSMLLSDRVVAKAKVRLEEALEAELPGLMVRLGERADAALDLNQLIVDKLLKLGPDRFVTIIRELGKGELFWIRIYGGMFGLLIGLVQFTVSNFFPVRLSLILVGMMVGAVTNYLAIQMLFIPRRPLNFGPFSFQGMFPKRQKEIATELATMAAEQFIIPEKIFARLAGKLLPTAAEPELARRLEEGLFSRFPAIKGLVAATLKPEQQEQFRRSLAEAYREEMPGAVKEVVLAAADQLDVNAILVEKVVALPKLRFEQFIRQLFAAEEIYLVIYGGLLGGMLGGMQLALLVLRNWV